MICKRCGEILPDKAFAIKAHKQFCYMENISVGFSVKEWLKSKYGKMWIYSTIAYLIYLLLVMLNVL